MSKIITLEMLQQFLQLSDKKNVLKEEKGIAGGVPPLDVNGIIPQEFLPADVDDVVVASTITDFPAVGAQKTIYIATDTGKQYKYEGSTYVELGAAAAPEFATIAEINALFDSPAGTPADPGTGTGTGTAVTLASLGGLTREEIQQMIDASIGSQGSPAQSNIVWSVDFTVPLNADVIDMKKVLHIEHQNDLTDENLYGPNLDGKNRYIQVLYLGNSKKMLTTPINMGLVEDDVTLGGDRDYGNVDANGHGTFYAAIQALGDNKFIWHTYTPDGTWSADSDSKSMYISNTGNVEQYIRIQKMASPFND